MGREHAPNGRDQTLEVNRFRVELVTPRGDGLLAFAGQRVRGHADDWDVLGLRIVLETPNGSQLKMRGRSWMRVLNE